MKWLAILLFPLLFNSSVFCEDKTRKEFKTKKVLAVFGYLNNYKLDQNRDYPEFLLAPIILVPKLIEIKSDTQGISDSKEKLEDNVKQQNTKPLKITNTPKVPESNDDIDVHFRQALNRGSVSKNDSVETKLNETLKPSDNSTKNKTTEDAKTTPKTATTEESKVNNNTNITTSTESSGIYPAADNNQEVNTITITNEPPGYFLLPPLLDNDIKNFSNINVSKEDNKTSGNSEQVLQNSKVNETDSTIKGPYPAALYNNTEIDQLSITTNLYTNGSPLPPPQDDRWKMFSSLDKMLPVLNEFRPLAGLYYDGFLHKPLYQKPGFVPYNHYHYYQ